VRYTTDDGGNVGDGSAGNVGGPAGYDPYGAPEGTSAPAPFGYTGELQDPGTGLVNLRARTYNPVVGQFLTRDPLEQQTGQAYAYANGDPVNQADSSGQDTQGGAGLIELAGPASSADLNDIKAVLAEEFVGRTKPLRAFVNVSLDPSSALIGKRIGQGLADLATETSVSGPQGYPTGEVYNFVPDVQQYPGYSDYDTSAQSTSLSYLIRIAHDRGLGPLCPVLARVDLQYGRNYTTVQANDVFTLHGQAFTQIPVTTHQGNRYLVFARQLPQAGFVAYSLCGVAAAGQVGYPCHPPDPGKYTCAFKSTALCVVDIVVFQGGLSAAHRCDSLGSCALATVGVAASLTVVGGLVVRVGAQVALATRLAAEGLSALTARIVTDESLVEVTDAESGVNREISTSEARTFIEQLTVASNAANAPRLVQQLEAEEAASAFLPNGELRPELIATAQEIIPGSKLGNPALVTELTRDGSDIADWGKYQSETFRSPMGPVFVHFYYNRVKRIVLYAYDYKIIRSGVTRTPPTYGP